MAIFGGDFFVAITMTQYDNNKAGIFAEVFGLNWGTEKQKGLVFLGNQGNNVYIKAL